MKRTFKIFGLVFFGLLGLAGMVMSFYSTELAAYGYWVMDDIASVKVLILSIALVAGVISFARDRRTANV